MITILSSPQLVQPVYNPIYLRVSSDETSQEGFNFLFDLYVNGVFINRTKLLPIPGTTECVYSPARILESYVSSDMSQNSTVAVASANCIDQYEIQYGEEYIVYYNYTTINEDAFTPSSYTIIDGLPNNPFSANENILIIQDSLTPTYPKYNGIHNIVSVPSSAELIINVNWTDLGPSLAESGKITYSDKRKTVFIGALGNIINNSTFQYLSGPGGSVGQNQWNTNSFMACNFGIDPSNKLIFNMPTTYTQVILTITYLGGTFISGNTYTISVNVDSVTDPSGAGQYLQFRLGGNASTYFGGIGNWSQTMICGGTNQLELIGFMDGGTGLIGNHSFSATNITVTAEEVIVDGYDFNGVIQYEEVPVWDYTKYQLDGITKKFLTKQPYTVKTKLEDRGSLSFMWLLEPDPFYYYDIQIVVTNNVGGTAYYSILSPSLNTALTTNARIQHIGVYPWNLNQYNPNIINSITSFYEVTIVKFDGETFPIEISETKRFELGECTKYDSVRFMFLNSLGAYDYYNATLLSRTNISIQRDSFTKTLGYNYQVGDRGKTNININAQESYIINTDWISEDTARWLSYEFFTSKDIFILDNITGVATPIILDNNSVEVKKRVNDKLLNYTFNYSKAVQLNTQRN